MKERVIDLIYRFKARCVFSEQEIMEEFNLTPAEYNGIAAMKPREKVSGSEVAERMNLSPSRGSRVVDRMVKSGYVVRKEDADDRRKCVIYLSRNGIEIKKKIELTKSDCEKTIHERLTKAEIDDFAQSIKKLMDVV